MNKEVGSQVERDASSRGAGHFQPSPEGEKSGRTERAVAGLRGPGAWTERRHRGEPAGKSPLQGLGPWARGAQVFAREALGWLNTRSAMRVRAGWVAAVCPVGQPEEPEGWLGAADFPSWAWQSRSASPGARPLSAQRTNWSSRAGPALGQTRWRASWKPCKQRLLTVLQGKRVQAW